MLYTLRLSAQRVWQQLTWGQRITSVGLSVAVVAAITIVVMWASAPTYSVLFSGLSTSDANAIVTQLDSAKVPYQLANGGTTILVPQSSVDAERLQMAGQGLPSNGTVGYALFDKQSIFQGDSFTEQVNLTRALEGELDNTIGSMPGIQYDRVNIVIPQQQLFSSQQASPTASVLLKFAPGGTLTSDQIAGVQHLVASSVEGLKPEAVTVVDGSGNILSSNSSDQGLSALGTTALQAQAQYASNLEAQLTAMLDTIVGPDKAVVHVNDTMDWTQRDATSNSYAPQTTNSPLVESKVVTSTTLGPGSTVGGVAGLASNVPTYGTKNTGSNTSAAGSSGQAQASHDLTYANSNVITHTVVAPGALTQLDVSVAFNGITNQATLTKLRQMISTAAGVNVTRGDQLSVVGMPFDNSVASAAAKEASSQQTQTMILDIVRWASLIIVPLLLLFLFRRLLRSTRVIEAVDQLALQVAEDRPLLSAARTEPQTLSIPEPEMSPVRRSVSDLAREKPEVVAGLIGKWIEEDRG